MRIRELDLPGIARLAPMAGISNAPFRLLARECGSAFTTSEEIDAISLIRGSPTAHDIVRRYPGERPIAYQLLGSDASLLVQAAELVQEAGADMVDLNMGCPVPKITRQGKGAALMRDITATSRILRALRAAVRVPLTIKIRGGWDDEHLNAVEVARMAEDEGVDAITVHPRTRSQRFHGRAPWQIIADVVAAVRLPVTGNGDVTSMAEARRMMSETGCAAVMIGRAALGRPWVFDERFETLEPAAQWAERARIIERHLALIEEHFASNPRYALNQVRKHLGWYVPAGMPYANRAQNAVHMARSTAEAKAAFWEWWHAVTPSATPEAPPARGRHRDPALA